MLGLHLLPWCPPQLKYCDTHYAHKRSVRFIIHEWEGLRQVHSVSQDGSGVNAPNSAQENRKLSLLYPKDCHLQESVFARPTDVMRGRGRILETLLWTLGEPSGSDVDLIIQILHRMDQWRYSDHFMVTPSPLQPGGLWFGLDAVICRLCPLVQFAVRIRRFLNHPCVTRFRLFLGCGVTIYKFKMFCISSE